MSNNTTGNTIEFGRSIDSVLITIEDAITVAGNSGVPHASLAVVFRAYGMPSNVFDDIIKRLASAGKIRTSDNLLFLA